MSVYQVIKCIVGVGVVIGGGDLLSGNRLGLGEKFKEGFTMTGRMMLSIAGIMSLAPLLAGLLEPVVVPLFKAIGIDPAVMGIFLGCDMGGYPLALSLAKSQEVAQMMGLATASMFGGTLTFSIPIGNAMLEEKERSFFFKGILYGIITIPFGSILGGIIIGVNWSSILINNIPVILLSGLLIIAFRYIPNRIIKIIGVFGDIITKVGVFGIIVGSVQYLTGQVFIKQMEPIENSMAIVCGMTMVLIGMLPLLEIFMRVMSRPLAFLGKRIKMDAISMSGIVFTMASAVPTFAMMKNMSSRGIVINAAWSVTCAALLGSQLSFVLGVAPERIASFTVSKVFAGVMALTIAYTTTRDLKQ